MIRFLQKSGNTTKYVLGGLLLIICASMVITLVPGGLGGDVFNGQPGRGIVAKVGTSDITADEVRQTAKQMLQQQMPQGGPNVAMMLPFFTQRAADQLIMRQVLIDEADRLGMRATPEEVKDELQHGRYSATLFPGGTFIGEQEYEQLLTRANLTPAKFEDDVVRPDIMISKLQAFVSGGASVSESEIREQFVKQNSKVKFDYAVLKQDDIKKGLHPSDAELKAFYDNHKASYANSIPEKRKIKYAVVDTAKAEASVKITQDDLRSYYDQYRDQYRTP
jgi:peptidyl-prolyl cis-trans isomerase D